MKKKEKKIKTFLVATNVVASRPPERRPTATPTARANKDDNNNEADLKNEDKGCHMFVNCNGLVNLWARKNIPFAIEQISNGLDVLL